MSWELIIKYLFFLHKKQNYLRISKNNYIFAGELVIWGTMNRITKIITSFLLLGISISNYAQLPDITLPDIYGQQVQVSTLPKQGHPVILSFFATWCKPCMRELNAISQVYDEWQETTGVEVVIVSVDEGQNLMKVKPLIEGNNWPFKTLLDTGGLLKQAMHVQNIPHVYVLNKEGQIVYNHVGYIDGDEENLIKCLR